MARHYSHTQRGTLMLITLSLAVLVAGLLGVRPLYPARTSGRRPKPTHPLMSEACEKH
jgi:hypothetical protein